MEDRATPCRAGGRRISVDEGQSAAALWNLRRLRMPSGMLYHPITVHSLYYAPIFGWLLLVSPNVTAEMCRSSSAVPSSHASTAP